MQKTETLNNRDNSPKFFLETYGCQMNVSDSEIVTSLLLKEGYKNATISDEPDVILMNTCAIRDNAEQKVRQRLTEFRAMKKRNPGLLIGVLGCMAERLKAKLMEEENLVDLVVGPDAYRSLPKMLNELRDKECETRDSVNVLLSREETYHDINPVRLSGNGVTAFISIMRGCDNMCSFCVVPFTRGRERSRNPESILNEAKSLFEQGYREITLLGQNVDSYKFRDKEQGGSGKEEMEDSYIVNFAGLLEMVAQISPLLRVRFTTSNPQDMTDDVLHVIAKYPNICKYIHLPFQSGNDRILKLMNRGYDRLTYLNRIGSIRSIIPGCAISADIIAGFCSETEEEHKDTMLLMEQVKFDYSYTFVYSERPGTPAAKKYKDDVPEDVKRKRVEELIAIQRKHSLESNKADIGKKFEVLVEGYSKRSKEHVFGRNTQNKVIIFKNDTLEPGDYTEALVTDCTSGTLIGEI